MENNSRKKAIIVTVIYGIIIFSIVAAILVGIVIIGIKMVTTEKEEITAKEFISIMEEHDYKVIEVTEQFEDADIEIDEGYIALEDDYQIEFYTFEDEENAQLFYRINESKIESSASSKDIFMNGKNYTYYSVTTGGKFKFVERIDNTVIYLNVDKEYKEEVIDILDELGY